MPDQFVTFRDPFLSIFQSAATEFARTLTPIAREPSDELRGQGQGAVRISAEHFINAANEVSAVRFQNAPSTTMNFDDSSDRGLADNLRTTADAARICANIGMKYLEALVVGDANSAQRLRGQLDSSLCDPRWARTLEEYSKYFDANGHRRPIAYLRPSTIGPRVIEIKSSARVAILGDWGTGAQPAIDLLRFVTSFNPDILIHLGDIYFSGTVQECETNFKKIVDDQLRSNGRTPLVYSLAGNHDMYSGGEGYYQLIKELNPPSTTQTTSFFCLRSTDQSWQFLAMDTGLHDYSPLGVTNALTFLEPDEESWHIDRVREFRGKTILLSHHQLFSAFSQIGPVDPSGPMAFNPNLLATYRKLQATGAALPAWFWGHEHNLCIYEPYGGLNRGRCLGHGAIPTFTKPGAYKTLPNLKAPPKIVEGTQLRANESIYANGFAVVDMTSAQQAEATYYQVLDGAQSVVYSELIS